MKGKLRLDSKMYLCFEKNPSFSRFRSQSGPLNFNCLVRSGPKNASAANAYESEENDFLSENFHLS